MNGHEATHNAGKGKKSTREVSSYEAQMIICILIIYPLAVSVHVMNENVFFFTLRVCFEALESRGSP